MAELNSGVYSLNRRSSDCEENLIDLRILLHAFLIRDVIGFSRPNRWRRVERKTISEGDEE